MKYLSWHLVDAVTGEYTNDCMTDNGLTHPKIEGLDSKFSFGNVFYGTCDDSVTEVAFPAQLLTEEELVAILSPLFEEIRNQKFEALNKLVIQKRDKLVSDSYHSSEITAGLIKYPQAVGAQAAADEASAQAVAPELTIEANVRGITVKTLADLVIVKYTAFVGMESQIAGYHGKLIDEYKALSFDPAVLFDNFDKFSAIDIAAGWPL